jgi:hypothetical protein
MRDILVVTHEAFRAAENRLTPELTLIAREVVRNRSDYPDLTEDLRERLERRAIYQMQALWVTFMNGTDEVFRKLETEPPPDLSAPG